MELCVCVRACVLTKRHNNNKNVYYSHTVHKAQNLEMTEIGANSRMGTFL